MRKNVALIYGGRGLEHEVSVLGANFVLPNIDNEKYNTIPIFIAKDGRWLVSRKDGEPARPDRAESREAVALINQGTVGGILAYGEFIPIDVAFPLLHGDFGEDGVVQGALDNAGITYVGENVSVSSLCLDKALTHSVAKELGIRGTDWLAFSSGADPSLVELLINREVGYPCFIKPVALGSSVGIGKATDKIDFIKKFKYASSFGDGRVIVEKCIDLDSELEIGVLRQGGKYLFTRVGKIYASSGFYDYDEKYSDVSRAIVDPDAVVEEKTEKTILDFARRLADKLEIRSLCRIDFFLGKDGLVYFNEINTMPGFTSKSLYPALMERSGIPIRRLIEILIEGALV